jgi:RNA polymerase sigma-70 factor (ECF subfamily)
MEKSFEVLVSEYQKPLFRYVASLTRDPHLAEDIVQDTFLAAYRSIQSGNRDIRNLAAWLRAIARNQLSAHARKATRIRFVRLQYVEETLEQLFGADDDPSRDTWGGRVVALKRCLKRLRERTREMVLLCYAHALTSAQIAERLGERADSVRHALSRARVALKLCVEKETASEVDSL